MDAHNFVGNIASIPMCECTYEWSNINGGVWVLVILYTLPWLWGHNTWAHQIDIHSTPWERNGASRSFLHFLSLYIWEATVDILDLMNIYLIADKIRSSC